MSRDGYLPCGVSGNESIFGTYDRDVSFTIDSTITITLDNDGSCVSSEDIIAQALKQVKQNYLGVTPQVDTLKIIDHEDEYTTYEFNATIEGDTCVDMSYVSEDDDSVVYDDIRAYVEHELHLYGIDDVEFDNNDISYEVS